MNSTDRELTRRMMLSSTIETVPLRRQMFIPHVDGAFISRFIRLGFILAIVFSCIGYFFIHKLPHNAKLD